MKNTVSNLIAMAFGIMVLVSVPGAFAEPSVETIAADNGIVLGPETGLETLSVTPGEVHSVLLIAEYAGMSGGTSGGWYVAGEPDSRVMLFSGPDSPVMNKTFTIPAGVTSIGFYIQPEWYPDVYWYSEQQFNIDGVDHVEIYEDEETGGYMVAFEDLRGGGDWDYNDHVIFLGPPAPEFVFAAMPLAIISMVILFSHRSAKRKY